VGGGVWWWGGGVLGGWGCGFFVGGGYSYGKVISKGLSHRQSGGKPKQSFQRDWDTPSRVGDQIRRPQVGRGPSSSSKNQKRFLLGFIMEKENKEAATH